MKDQRGSHRRTRAEGFTLIEMMISVTLIAMMALCIWAVLRISISSWKRGTEFMDENQRRRATLDLIQKQMASISSLVPPLDLQTGAGQSPIFVGSDTSVEFISLSALRFRDNPGLAVVSYEVVSGKEGDYSLVERETRYLGGDPTLDVNFDLLDVPVTTIFEHLAGLSFEYYDPGNGVVPPQWVKEWDAQDDAGLPTALSMTINTRDTNGAIQSRQVIIPIMAETDSTQPSFVDPFEGRRGGSPGFNNPPGGGRRGTGANGPPPGGRRGPGFGFPPPGGGRRGPGDNVPFPGGGRGGRFQ